MSTRRVQRNHRKILNVLERMGAATYDELMLEYRDIWRSQSFQSLGRRLREMREQDLIYEEHLNDGRVLWRPVDHAQ